MKIKIKDGVDGSGSYALYQQANNVNTNNMIMYMFCLLEIVDNQTNAIIFKEKLSNSPHAMRPIFITMGKETISNLINVKEAFSKRNSNAEFVVQFKHYAYNIQIEAQMTLIDGKMRALLSGLGGAYCLLCFITSDVACGRHGTYSSYFNITRSAENTMSVWNNLVDENNVIKKRKSDYSVRGGLTQEPIIEEDLNMVSPLHCLLCIFRLVLLLIYHLRSETFVWSESEKKLGDSYDRYCKAKAEAKEIVFSKTGIKMDMPDATGKGGTTNTGNICERLLTDYQHILVSLVPPRFQSDMVELLNRLWVIISIYTSKPKDDLEVNTTLYGELCVETYDLIINCFENSITKWINVSPTLHMLLAHSWEIIEMNKNQGLGDYSETGLEHNNKFLRFFRQILARKTSQETNLQDCIERLWLKSDPKVRHDGPIKMCSTCKKVNDHSTVSCYLKKKCSVKCKPTYQTCMTFYEFYISQLYQ